MLVSKQQVRSQGCHRMYLILKGTFLMLYWVCVATNTHVHSVPHVMSHFICLSVWAAHLVDFFLNCDLVRVSLLIQIGMTHINVKVHFSAVMLQLSCFLSEELMGSVSVMRTAGLSLFKLTVIPFLELLLFFRLYMIHAFNKQWGSRNREARVWLAGCCL